MVLTGGDTALGGRWDAAAAALGSKDVRSFSNESKSKSITGGGFVNYKYMQWEWQMRGVALAEKDRRVRYSEE